MTEPSLRKLHRWAGVVMAPLAILQAASGMFLSVDWLLGFHHRAGEALRGNIPLALRLWDALLVDIHYGMGALGAVYHIFLGAGLIWVAISGIVIFVKIRARQKR